MKICGICKEEKDLNEFHINPTKKDGVQSMCKECRKVYHKEHYLKNKEKYINNANKTKRKLLDVIQRYKSIKGCSKCGDKRWYVLDFHHIGDKDFNISEEIKRGLGKEKLKKELSKCIIVCSNCHREIHYLERQCKIGVSDSI